jgi:general secretion pathway protein K
MTMRRAPSKPTAGIISGTLRPPQRQRGAAIIMALLVVAIAATLVSGLLWRQQIQVRRIENQRLRDQAQWAARSATDWTRFILRTSADVTPVDYLGGVWAVPIAPTRVSDVLGHNDDDAGADESTYLSGSIEDAQAYFNLRNLIWSPMPGQLAPNPSQLKHFQRLLQLLGVDSQLADPVAQRMRSSLEGQATRFQQAAGAASGVIGAATAPQSDEGASANRPGLQDDDDDTAAGRPLPPLDLDWLLEVPGFTPEAVTRLRPFVTILPLPTTVNINTTPAEVLAAMIPGMNLSQAQTLVLGRDKAFFINIGDLSNRLGGGGPVALQPDNSELDVKSGFFLVHGQISHERAHLQRDTLLYRDYITHATRIVSVRDTY